MTTNNDSDDTPGHDAPKERQASGVPGAGAGKHEPEEALETHEVVEINKLTEKKEWIEEKIKLLEGMPPIQVFAAVQVLQSLPEEIPPNLPTRAQLNHWLEEHDKTEKETEVFDAEDMSKLKKLTKAATQRNLSPEDTDLIELTLTTLIALDRLLHLLRDRSETLDLLGLRLTWEEQRVAAWRDRRTLLSDLEAFLSTRGRWSLDTYELPPPFTPSSSPKLKFASPLPSVSPRPSTSLAKRRDSAASVASISSETSISMTGPSLFSRSTRYRLAEQLSHEAALFSGRLTALNHGKVVFAGKTLDRLIDASRKPVPDEILDEQDRLEDKGVKEVETVGKFAMSVVMQWKRADEHYHDTKKDQVAAQTLIIELNSASLQHPTPRHDAAFTSRAQALTKRLAVRGDPALPRIPFPRPMHPLFPGQGASNEAVVKTLSAELVEAVELTHQAEAAALAYRAALEAVRRAEGVRDQMRSIDGQLEKLTGKLVNGVHDDHGGSPPKLDDETCLDPTRHSAFLALLPSVVQELEQADRAAERVLRDAKVASLRLKELSGVDPKLKEDLETAIEGLDTRRSSAKQARDDLLARAQRLKEARRLWGILDDILGAAEAAKEEAVDAMESQRWTAPEGHRDGAPLTPDPDKSEQAHYRVTLTPGALLQRLDALDQRVSTDFKGALTTLSAILETPVCKHLQLSSEGLSKHIDNIRGLARHWKGILNQAADMVAVQRDAHELEGMINVLQADTDDARHDVLDGSRDLEAVTALETGFKSQATTLQDSIRTFTDSLATRVSLVARTEDSRAGYPRSKLALEKIYMSNDQRLNGLKDPPVLTLPFDLAQLDSGVRAEANSIVLRLAGGMQSAARKLDYLRLSCLAKTTDIVIENLARDIGSSEQTLSDIRTSFESIRQSTEPLGLDISFSEALDTVMEHIDRCAEDQRNRLFRSASLVRQTLEALQAAPGAHDSPIHGTAVAPRLKAANDVLCHVDTVNESMLRLKACAFEAQQEERERLRAERERLETEEKARIEQARLEAAERAEQEEARSQAEVRARLEKERLDTEEKARMDAASRLEQASPEVAERTRIEHTHIKGESAMAEPARVDVERERGDGRVTELQQRNAAILSPQALDEDVFGLRLSPSVPTITVSSQVADLRARIMTLRTRLRSLSLGSLVQSSAVRERHSTAALPTSQEASDAHSRFSAIVSDTAALPATVPEDAVITELVSLRSELDAAGALVQRLLQLGLFSDKVVACDHALSDLLEHADSYPAAPAPQQLASSHVSDTRLPCEEQLANRLAFAEGIMREVSHTSVTVADDIRVVVEQSRLRQTWTELADMCTDRINGTRSRPASSVSSTGRSSVGTAGSGFSTQRKAKPSLNERGRRPRPSGSSNRRSMSSAHDPIRRPSTHLSNRSISGPSGLFSSLYSSTFASRQRTTSLASIQSATATPVKRPVTPTTRPPGVSKRPGSPTFSESSGHSLASTPPRSSWSRAPRQSFGTLPRNINGLDRTPKRKAYVANPKSKLDVAVGNVINNFRVPVTILPASDVWKDQSGKYWIGDDEPKLCFCRILRSQTVMVRVGGGWCELSKFLRGHFADLLADLPPSPPRKEERWISSATLIETSESPISIPATRGLTTPEPEGLLPSLQLSTPNGTTPQSLKTSPSPNGSPGLTPFQFMRRADQGVHAVTPSPSKSTRMKPATPGVAVTPSRTNVWRP